MSTRNMRTSSRLDSRAVCSPYSQPYRGLGGARHPAPSELCAVSHRPPPGGGHGTARAGRRPGRGDRLGGCVGDARPSVDPHRVHAVGVALGRRAPGHPGRRHRHGVPRQRPKRLACGQRPPSNTRRLPVMAARSTRPSASACSSSEGENPLLLTQGPAGILDDVWRRASRRSSAPAERSERHMRWSRASRSPPFGMARHPRRRRGGDHSRGASGCRRGRFAG